MIKKRFETRALDSLIPYENNPRFNDEAVEDVKESIRQTANLDPIEVDENGVILSGHTRLKALQAMGYTETEVIVYEGLTEEQKRKYRILANKTGEKAEWDLRKLQEELEGLDFEGFDFGFDMDEAEMPDDTEPTEDDYEPEPPEEPRTQRGQIYQLGRHRLMCGDSTDPDDVKELTGGAEMDMLLTDPPYNVALGQHKRPSEAKQLHRRTDGLVIDNDSWDNDEDFIDFLEACFKNALDSMRPGAAFYIWYSTSQTMNFMQAAEKAGMEVRQQLVWNKNNFVLGRQDYQWKHEPCLYGWKDGAAHYFIDVRNIPTVIEDGMPEIGKMKKADMVRLLEEIFADKVPTTVLNENKPARSELHPTMKPIKLVAQQIQNSTKPGWNVLDLFGGSGSTLIACEQLNRDCYMMELDPHYVDVIIDRWETFTGEKAVLINE